ncbi:MAG: DUF6503 family protein [Rhodothermales bacterium]
MIRARTPLALLAVALLFAACAEPERAAPVPPDAVAVTPEPVPTDSAAVAIIERARRVHGADVLDRAVVGFSFRGASFTAERDGDRFVYARTWTDSAGVVRDTLGNDGFGRTVNGTPVALRKADALAAEGAVNSVVYFALLPYPLADAAVQPRLVGVDTLGGEAYDLVEVTFRPEGGGRDYQDRFVYWIHRDRSTVDYLAYSYEVSGGGARFREAYNPRTVGGVRFVDYRNYSAEPLEPSLEGMGRMFEADSLDLLSEIVLDDVRVRPLP